MEHTDFDAIVIGGGSAGLAFAKCAARLGGRILLVEQEELGGTCVNRGCVPKKLMWTVAQARLQARAVGLDVPFRDADFATMAQARDAHIEELRDTFADGLAEAGVTLQRGQAELAEGGVRLDDEVLTARHVVLATGSAPSIPGMDGADLMETSREVFGWPAVPARLTILGAGYIGTEFATIFAALGATVDLIDDGDAILDGFDGDAAQVVQENLQAQGVSLHLGTRIVSVERSDGGLTATLKDGTRLAADKVVCAIGRDPRFDTLGPLAEEIERVKSGAARIGEGFETSRAGVFAIGDCADRLPLTPVATHDGETLATQLFGEGRARLDLGRVATAAFALPPIAQIGEFSGGGRLTQGRITPLGNAVRREGMAPAEYHKTLLDESTGQVVAHAMVAEGAHEAIAWSAIALAAGAGPAEAGRIAAIHPSFAEDAIQLEAADD